MNCRSAHARYPGPACTALAELSKRTFAGYAYALDISTKTRNEDSNGYKIYKEAFLQTSKTEVQTLKAKEARFQVWPVMQLQQSDGTKLDDYLQALSAAI